MNRDSIIFENDDQRRRAVAWVVALATTLPVPSAAGLHSAGRPVSSEYQVLYRSKATKRFTNQELLDLLENARSWNVKHQVTGILLYSEGRFVQVIEGQEEIIVALYERIRQDSRHHEVDTLSEGLLPARRFTEWSMDFGYAAGLDASAAPLPGLSTTKAHLQQLLELFIG